MERRANWRSTSTMWVSASVPTSASETAPCCSLTVARTASRPSSIAASTASANGRKARPASVSFTPPRTRSSSGAPSSCSIKPMRRLIAGCERLSRPAARVKPPSWAMETKVRISSTSMTIGKADDQCRVLCIRQIQPLKQFPTRPPAFGPTGSASRAGREGRCRRRRCRRRIVLRQGKHHGSCPRSRSPIAASVLVLSYAVRGSTGFGSAAAMPLMGLGGAARRSWSRFGRCWAWCRPPPFSDATAAT